MIREKKSVISNIIISILMLFGINVYLSLCGLTSTGSFLNVFLFVTLYISVNYVQKVERRIKVYSCVFGILMSMATVLGKVITKYNSVTYITKSFYNFSKVVIIVVGLGLLIACISAIVIDKIIVSTNIETKLWKIYQNRYIFFAVWGILFLVWVPIFLAFYPGNYSYDIPWQMLSKRFHPLLHTGFWVCCINVGNATGIDAMVLYSIIQMLILSAGLAKIVKFMIDRKAPNLLILFSFLFFAFNPCIVVLSFSTTKDVFFAVAMIFLTIYLFELLQNINLSIYIKLAIAIVFACFLRNNAAYALILTAPFAIWILRKQWKRITLVFVASLAFYFVINGPVMTKLGIENVSLVETMSVPLQQLGNLVSKHYDDIEKQDQIIMDDMMDHTKMKKLYIPEISDNIKFNMNENHQKSYLDYGKVWMKYLPQYPAVYFDAFLKLNLQLWAPDTIATKRQTAIGYIKIPDGIEGKLNYNHYYNKYIIKRDSKLPRLRQWYKYILKRQPFTRMPLLSIFFYLSFPLWVLLFSIMVIWIRKQKKNILAMLPSIFFLLTSLIGPATLARYIFPVLVLCPIFLTIAICHNEGRRR